jgi:hypothetical protein
MVMTFDCLAQQGTEEVNIKKRIGGAKGIESKYQGEG